ncbi:uncharacterized protein [Nicotiana tomentosiformis]|uniref:uncharacterized protein n=1 Tax=Nicotiana tomentosiformis TaxID=4098 RepID=UPI00388CCA87
MPLTVEKATEKLSTLNVKPSVLVVKGPPNDFGASQEKPKVVVPGIPGKPIIIVEGARITPVIIKPVTQLPMVDTKAIPWNYKQELRKAKSFRDGHIPVKKPVTEEEDEEFLIKMKMQDYSIVEQLRKTPAQISLLSFLIYSDEHRKALMKILNKAHVPDKITGTEHNRALYLTVKCEDSFVSRVLVDNGSSANIFPLSTMQKLKISTERIHMNNVCVQGFDRGGKDSVGDIMLELTIGLVEFIMEFQVLDVAVSYNLLLGRTWIQAAKAVPSSLHQMLKIVKGLGSTRLSKQCQLRRFLRENAFQGIIHLVCLRESLGTFGLGFKPTGKDVKRVKKLKRKAWSLPKHVPHISKSFVKPEVAKRPISVVPKPVVDFDEELIKRFQSLFDEVNMVEIGEGSSNADVQLVGPNVKLSNWKATSLPTRKEFCSFYVGFNDMTCMRNFQPKCDDETEYDEEVAFQEISRELNHFEETPKPNLNENELINSGDQDNIRETKISVHLEPQIKEKIIKALFEYKDVFAWSYDDMPGLSADLVVHKFPIDPAFPPVKQKLRKFKTDMSVKIKEEITKQLDAKVIQVTRYPTWLANIVPVPKKDGKTRVCVDYRDLNKASPMDNFPLPNIHILIDNCAKHEIGSFMDCYAGYHQILIDEEDAKNIAFITPWGTYCFRIMPFGLKNAGKPMPIGRLAKWKILLTEFDIIYVTRTAMKAQALANHLAKNPVDEEYEPLKTYFLDEEVMYVDEVDHDEKPSWKLFSDGAANMKGVRIGIVLISETKHHYPITAQLRFYCTNNMAEYEACILGLGIADRHGSSGNIGFGRFRFVGSPDSGRMGDSGFEAHTVSRMSS